MDGENTSLFPSGRSHARSIDSANPPILVTMLKILARTFLSILPPWLRVCGENLYTKHSIHLKDLERICICFFNFGEKIILV